MSSIYEHNTVVYACMLPRYSKSIKIGIVEKSENMKLSIDLLPLNPRVSRMRLACDPSSPTSLHVMTYSLLVYYIEG